MNGQVEKHMNGYDPKFANPYPQSPCEKISDFEYLGPLILYRAIDAVKMRGGKEDADYVLFRPYPVRFKVDGKIHEITVPQGMLTDLASVPRIARSIIDRVGPHLEASIVHDFLYIAWQDIGGYSARTNDQAFADKVMRAALRAANIPERTILEIYGAVRTFGWFAFRERNGWPRYVVVPSTAC